MSNFIKSTFKSESNDKDRKTSVTSEPSRGLFVRLFSSDVQYCIMDCLTDDLLFRLSRFSYLVSRFGRKHFHSTG